MNKEANSTFRALKLALEAMENMVKIRDCQREKGYPQSDADKRMQTAITALQEALANEALDKKAENARELGLDYEPAQQEPVACFSVFRSISGERNTRFLELASLPDGEHYFYTSPPSLSLAQRTWQGLTDKELQPIADEYRILFGSWVEDFARAIEAKLKAKNFA